MEIYKKIAVLLAILLVVIVIFPKKSPSKINPVQVSATTVVAEKPTTPSPPQLVDANIPKPELAARAVLALDLPTGAVLYSQNENEKLPIASLTKLMTAMVVLDHVNSDKIVTIQKADTEVDCACMGLEVGEQITVQNLLKGMLIPSNNDAALALGRFVGGTEENFVGMMNDKAHTLGLADTHFANPVGLDDSENYSTATDLARETQEFLKYALLERIVATAGEDVTSVEGKIVHHLKTSNKLLLENSDVVGVKTGFTSGAQGNLILKIEQSGGTVLTVVLNTPNREDDTQKLIDWIFGSYKW